MNKSTVVTKRPNDNLFNHRFELNRMTIEEYRAFTNANGITLPRFQRGAVWSANDMLSLLTTIKNGEPMPTIVVAEVSGLYYLLDGQQRTNAFGTLLSKFSTSDKFTKTVEVIQSYEVAVMKIKFDDMTSANDLYNRLNAKSGLTVGQKTKGTVHATFQSLYDFIQSHEVVKGAYTKTTKAKVGDDESDSVTAMVEKTEDITNALVVASVMPSLWSTQTSALAKILSAQWSHERPIEDYFDDISERLYNVAEVMKLRKDDASRIKSNKAVFVSLFLLAKEFSPVVMSNALKKVFDGANVVPIKREVVVEDSKGKSKSRKESTELFGSGSSNDSTTSKYKEGFLRVLCLESRAELEKIPTATVSAEEVALLHGLAQ